VSAARALATLFALALAGLGGCGVCPYVEQTIFVAQDDPELASVVSDCRSHVPPTNEPRCASGAVASTRFDCACLPLCDRLYAIVVPDPSREPLAECVAQPMTSTTNGQSTTTGQLEVSIKYRSRCP